MATTVRELLIRWGFRVDGRPLQRMQKSIIGIKGLAVAAGGALVGLAGAFKLAGYAGKFEFEMAKVGAVSRATAADMKLLEEAAIQAGIETQFSPMEAAQGLRILAQAGFTAAESMRLLKPTLDLAAGGQLGLEQASETVAAAVRVFQLEGDEAVHVADRLLKISNLTTLTAGDLQIALGNVSRGAVAAGQDINEMLTAIGLVRETGVDASVAASSVSSALEFMAKKREKFRAMGIALTDSTGKFRPFLDIVRETNAALDKGFKNQAARVAKTTDLFGRFGKTAVSAIRVARGQVDQMRDSLRNADGTAEEFRKRLLDTFEGQKVLLRGTLQTMAVVLGKQLIPYFREATTGLNEWIIRNREFIAQGLKDVLEGIRDKLSLVKELLVGVSDVLGTGKGAAEGFLISLGLLFAPAVINGLLGLKKAILGVNVAIKANPIVALLVLTGILITTVIRNWDALRDAVRMTGVAVGGVVRAFGDFFQRSAAIMGPSSPLGKVVNALGGYLAKIGAAGPARPAAPQFLRPAIARMAEPEWLQKGLARGTGRLSPAGGGFGAGSPIFNMASTVNLPPGANPADARRISAAVRAEMEKLAREGMGQL